MTVQAAGGLVIRRGPDGQVEIVVVHRPLQDDWTLPKGKLEPGETPEEAALREVREETGLTCELVRPAGRTAYVDRSGRDKVVRYWVMRPLAGGFRPTREVDRLRWLSVDEALSVLSYPTDHEVVARQDLATLAAEVT